MSASLLRKSLLRLPLACDRWLGQPGLVSVASFGNRSLRTLSQTSQLGPSCAPPCFAPSSQRAFHATRSCTVLRAATDDARACVMCGSRAFLPCVNETRYIYGQCAGAQLAFKPAIFRALASAAQASDGPPDDPAEEARKKKLLQEMLVRRVAMERVRAQRSQEWMLYAGAIVALMLGLTYAAVPLYRLFCQATGYGGTIRRSSEEVRA
eukprot:scaffold1201_cov413-Prasinococcus_capsulatus_cf.AAC.6